MTIARLSSLDHEAPLVTQEDREEWLAPLDRYQDRAPALRSEMSAMVPERKPALEQLVVDDERRLWVRRSVTRGELPVYDLFSADAEYLGSVRMPAGLSNVVPPVVRSGRVYFVALDELDVPFVMAGPVPVP